jgi:hypothetical protein
MFKARDLDEQGVDESVSGPEGGRGAVSIPVQPVGVALAGLMGGGERHVEPWASIAIRADVLQEWFPLT